MTVSNRQQRVLRRGVHGQTLIIAIIILGVLLILGFAFASIISRNITEAGRSARRTVAGDLSRAGVEYAHSQLLYGALGADWKPSATLPQIDGFGNTKDPDAHYLRPGTGLVVVPNPARPTVQILDRGGPDYMGPYSRVTFDKGRALVRVRWAPSSYGAFAAPVRGGLRDPGLAKNFLIIESVGRPGSPVDTQGKVDPTKQFTQSVQVAGFPDQATLQSGIGTLRTQDAQITDSRRLIAFASIGIIETARFITNKHNVSRKAEIGFPATVGGSPTWSDQANAGVSYEGFNVQVPQAWGANPSGAANVAGSTSAWTNVPGGGSLWSNAGLIVHGVHSIVLNQSLGEVWATTGQIEAANQGAALGFQAFRYNGGADQWQGIATAISGNAMASSNPQFSTGGGLLRDGVQESDSQGYPRRLASKVPPSILTEDPQGGQNRYLILTRQSGALNPVGQNRGRFGYGRGVYVDSNERGNVATEDLREIEGAVKSLPNDWLNPNNATSQGWQGPYYVPVAAYLHLLPDGFEIIRDSRSRNRFWRNPNNGGNLSQSVARYWVRKHSVDGKMYIINSIDFNVLGLGADPSGALTDDQFRAHPLAQEFNGVVMFEGDVRTRGVIPTDCQISVVSMGTIYVEGSITKGIVGRVPGSGSLQVLNRPSRSMIMLMAQDYVTLNTTQFFAPAPGQTVRPKNADNVPDTPNPIELDLAEAPEVTLLGQFLLNPVNNNPASWTTFAEQYQIPGGLAVSGPLNSNLLVTASADDNGPSFVSMDVITRTYADGGPNNVAYLFPTTLGFATTPTATTLFFNAAGTLFPPATNIPVYGLGDPNINSYPKFETIAMPIFNAGPGGSWNAYSPISRKLTATNTNPEGQISLSVQDPTLFRVRINTVGTGAPKNFLAARTAIAPFDVRIEAAMFAEEGSFFVIPGNWFNTNSDDTRTRFENRVVSLGGNVAAINYGGGNPLAQAQLERFEQFGNSPEVPFYGEPLDVRISIVGAVSENMPAPMSQQTEWLQKWGWIPRRLGASGLTIPDQHRPAAVNFNNAGAVVPNITISYDPALATGSASANEADPIRVDENGWLLPPMPRLPVSPTLAYFGDENP